MTDTFPGNHSRYEAGFSVGAADRRRSVGPFTCDGDDRDWVRGYLAGWNQPTVRIEDRGNNESVALGVQKQGDGTFIAITYSRSRVFKTERGACMWYRAAMGLAA